VCHDEALCILVVQSCKLQSGPTTTTRTRVRPRTVLHLRVPWVCCSGFVIATFDPMSFRATLQDPWWCMPLLFLGRESLVWSPEVDSPVHM
jgi:hypothetical protein